MPERQCSKCSEVMKPGNFGPLELDICLPCGGIWFDCGELGRLISAGPQIVRRLAERVMPSRPDHMMPRRSTLTCPLCHIPLSHSEYPSLRGARVDACQFCEGYWVDRLGLILMGAALEGASQWEIMRLHELGIRQPLGGQPAAAQPGVTPVAPQPPAAPGQPAPSAHPGVPGTPAHGAPPAPATAGPKSEACPNCDEPNAEHAAVCWACGHPLQAPVVGACPRCEASMRRLTSDGVTISACDGCGGVWVNPTRLNALILQPAKSQKRIAREAGRFRAERRKQIHPDLTCPHCTQAMFTARLGMLTPEPVPTCPKCYGLFLRYETFTEILPEVR